MDERKVLADSFPVVGDVRAKQVAAYLCIGISTLWLYVRQGRIDPPKRYGARVSLWSAEYVRQLREGGLEK